MQPKFDLVVLVTDMVPHAFFGKANPRAGRNHRALTRVIPFCLLLAFLSGCSLSPHVRDPFVELDKVQRDAGLKQMTVGLIVSDNTLETLKYAEDINRKEMMLNFTAAIPDLKQKISDYRGFLKKTFKTVIEIDKGTDLQTVPVDLLAVMDMHFDELGLMAFGRVAFSVKTVFLAPSRETVAEMKGRATREFGFLPNLKWQRYIEEAINQADADMGNQIVSSPQLTAFAKTRAGYGDYRTNSPQAAEAVAVKSDVDELPARKAKSDKKAYAIVIGIERYRQKFPNADFAAHDARIVTDYLTKVLGYPEENVITLLNERALKSDFEKYFGKWLANNVEAGSTVFVYYSGLGAPEPKSGSAYIVPYDGDPAFIDQTGYSLQNMYAALGRLPARKIVVALDACFSGAGGRSVLAKGARPLVMTLPDEQPLSANMQVMSAASGQQQSSGYEEKGHGLFTYFLLKGIKNEDVTAKDGSLEVGDLFDYLKPQVERIARKQFNNEQTPRLIQPNGK